MWSTPSQTPPEDLGRRNFLKWGVILVTAATLPSVTLAWITDATRKKVEAVKREFPNFKLWPDEQKCFDGTLNDPECDLAINEEISSFKKEQQINAKEQQINAREKELQVMKSARDNISIVIWLVQLWLYIDYEKIPPKDADYMDIVMSDSNTPKEVQSLFVEFLKRKKSGWTFTWKADGERLINLANKHLQIANTLQWQLTNETFKKQASAMYSQAASSYTMAREMLAKKA